MTVDEGAPDVGGRDDRLLSWDQVERIASISRSTAWRMERDGAFPRRVRVSPGRVGWWESELTQWKRSRSGEVPPPPPRKEVDAAVRQPALHPNQPDAPPPERYVQHEVESGENLTEVSRRYQTTVPMLEAANPQLAQSDQIEVG